MQRDLDLIRRRLIATGLAEPADADPAAAVRRLGCAQGQDLPGVIASLALRVPGATAAAVTDAMTRGDIVRGYPMRTTVFAVHADDLGWMGELLRPSFANELARRRKGQGVDEVMLRRVREVALEALDAPARPDLAATPDPSLGLTRAELGTRWSEAGIEMSGARLYHFISTLMVEGELVYGPWDAAAKDQRVVSAASWIPADSSVEARFGGDRTAAIAEWLRRYLVSRGPATLRDFGWWTKLGLGKIRKAAPAATEGLAELEVDGEAAWCAPEVLEAAEGLRTACDRPMLLPGFDELVLGYRDRGYLLTPEEHEAAVPGNNGIFRGLALDRARPVGTWRRGGSGARRRLEVTAFEGGRPISQRAAKGFERAFAAHPWIAP
ncbi:hypothetical protein USB125703_01984 [Pseudoclavibacter triregionum]|nr:hypothetical protein USB125703_01984 [Pseudoclavibacter triregionum]